MSSRPPQMDRDLGIEFTRSMEVSLAELVVQKLVDAEVPGFMSEFTAEEADMAGAFEEDALGEHEAYDSSTDLALASAQA